jgi:hypothetical protein
VQSVSTTVPLGLSLSGGALVVLGTLALIAIVSVAFLLTGGAGSAYDQIGAGGIAREGEYDGAPAAASDSSAGRAERELEIRQLLSARSERLVRSGRPALDVDAELARLLAAEPSHDEPSHDEPSHDEPDPELVAEVRTLVVARNERRIRQGMEPLDVEAEVARTLEQLGP